MHPDPHVRLAHAKLATMFQDLAGRPMGCSKSEKGKANLDAYRWFFGKDSDLADWCVMAEVCPTTVKKGAKKVWERGFEGIAWRAEAGKGRRYGERHEVPKG